MIHFIKNFIQAIKQRKEAKRIAELRKMLNAAFCILEDSYDGGSSISNKVAYADEISQKISQHITDFKKLNASLP